MSDVILVYETMTGRAIATPAVSSYTWSTGINSTEGSISITTTATELPAHLSTPWKYSIAVVDEDGEALAAGPIFTRDADFATGKITIGAGGFWSLLKKRVFQRDGVPIVADNSHAWIATDGSRADWRQTYNSSLGGIATGLIRSQFRDIPGVASFPYPEVTPPRTRTYDALELQAVADLVSNVFDDTNPPLIRFRPVFADGVVTWAADLLGETVQPSRIFFDLDADAGILDAATITEDAGSAVNQAWLVSKPSSGAPSDNSSLFAQSTRALAAGEPRLSVADSSHSDISDPATLDGYATALAYSTPYMSLDLHVARHRVTARRIGMGEPGPLRPGDTVVVSTMGGFYGPSTFAGRIVEIRGDHKDLAISVENVTRVDGAYQPAQPSAQIQRPAGAAVDRIKELEAFQRRAGNPVTDKPGVPVLRTPIALTSWNADFTNVDLTATRLDPLGIVVIEGSFTANRLKMGTEAIATLVDSHPLTQISLSAIREGSTSETLQAWITTAGAITVKCDPTIYSGNTVTLSGLYTIVN